MAGKKSFVKDYMTKDVINVTPETKTQDVIALMKKSRHNSYPVIENNKLVGMITAFDIVSKEWADTVKDLMTTKLVVANQNLSINDASRVMFRRGISRMPVVDEKNTLVGIITNTDMVRSHIERSTPNKVEYFKKTMEQLYGIKTTLKHKVDSIMFNKDLPIKKKRIEIRKLAHTKEYLEKKYIELFLKLLEYINEV